MSIPLATRGYIGAAGSSAGPGFVGELSPSVSTEVLEPEINQVYTQGNPNNPGAPKTVVNTVTDLKPTITKKPRRR